MSKLFMSEDTRLDRILRTPEQKQEDKLYGAEDRLLQSTFNLIDVREDAGMPVNEGFISDTVKNQVIEWGKREWKGAPPPDAAKRLRESYDRRVNSIYRELSESKRRDEKSVAETMERGAVMFPGDVYRNEDQIAAMKGGRTFGLTEEQVYSRLVRLGRIPKEEFSIVTSLQSGGVLKQSVMSPEAGREAGLSEETRKSLKEAFDRRYFGGADLDEERLQPGWFSWMNDIPGGRTVKALVGTPIGALTDIITAPAKGLAAGPAHLMREARKSGYLSIVQTVGIPTAEDIEAIDRPKKYEAMSLWEQQKYSFGTDLHFSEFGKVAKRDQKRFMGLTKEQAKTPRFSASIGGYGKAMALGAVHSDKAPTQTDEYARLLDAYTVAAENGIRGLDPADPRYSRYFSESDEARAREAMKIAIDANDKDTPKVDLIRAAKGVYAAMPRQKMLEDMLALDEKGWEIKHPDLADLAFQLVFDPLWGVNVLKGFLTGGKYTIKGVDMALTKVAPETMAASKAHGNALITSFQKGFRHHSYTDEGIKEIGEHVSGLSEEAKAASKVEDLDSLEDSVRLTMQVAEGQGIGASQKLGKKAQVILYHLAKVKGEKAREALWAVLEGRMSTAAAVRGGLLSRRQAARVPHIKRTSKEIHAIIDEAKQLDMLENGFINTAAYEKYYVPRVIGDTKDLHNAVVKLGYTDLVDAATKLFPKGASTLSKRLKALDDSYTSIGEGYKALVLAAKNGDETAAVMKLSTKHQRELRKIGAARAAAGEETLNGVFKFKSADSTMDALGARGTHHFINPKTGRAIERKKVAALYPWLKDPYVQWEVALKELIYKTAKSAETKALVEAFGINKVAGIIAKDTGMIKVAPSAYKGADKATRLSNIRKVEKSLTEQMGLEMVALEPAMAKRAASSIIESGGKFTDDGIIFVPKAMSDRLYSLYHVAGTNNMDVVANGWTKFRNEIVRPANTTFRISRTVMRAPAFHALNYMGAVGLGMLAHGAAAANPFSGKAWRLQIASHKAAFHTAFGGNAKALGHLVPLGDGSTVELGKLIQAASDFGIINQGAAKYAFDIASNAKGKFNPFRIGEKYTRWSAKFTRAQQVAEFADDYQKFVAFIGWHMRHGTAPKGEKFFLRDMQKAVKFTSEYAGNYNHLSTFERTWMRDAFTFYSWNRFIMPHLARQVFENPRRLAAFEKVVQAIRYQTKENAPGVTGLGVPPHLAMQRAFIAPSWMQPKKGQAGPHEFGMAVMETPIASQALFAGGFYGEGPVQAMMGPFAWALVGAFTGFDKMGERSWQKDFVLPTLEDFSSMGAAKDYLYRADESAIGRNILQTVNVPVPFAAASLESYMNLAKLYTSNGMEDEAIELWLRYRVGRDFLGLDNIVAKMFGHEGRSLSGYGVLRGYGVSPESTAARHQGLMMSKADKN